MILNDTRIQSSAKPILTSAVGWLTRELVSRRKIIRTNLHSSSRLVNLLHEQAVIKGHEHVQPSVEASDKQHPGEQKLYFTAPARMFGSDDVRKKYPRLVRITKIDGDGGIIGR